MPSVRCSWLVKKGIWHHIGTVVGASGRFFGAVSELVAVVVGGVIVDVVGEAWLWRACRRRWYGARLSLMFRETLLLSASRLALACLSATSGERSTVVDVGGNPVVVSVRVGFGVLIAALVRRSGPEITRFYQITREPELGF